MGKIKYCWNCGHEVPYQIYENIDYVPVCSECGTEYPEKTKDEAMLAMCQNKYLADRSDKNFNELFKLLNRMTFNVIRHKLKAKSSWEHLEDIYDKVQWTLEKLTKYYKEKPDFKIKASFAEYIGQIVLYPLYNKEEQERHKNEISIHTPLFGNTDKSTKELNDYLSKDDDGNINNVENSVDYENNQRYLIIKSLDFIGKSIDALYEYEESKKTGKEFKNSYFMAQLYKFFIFGKYEDKNVEDIKNSVDYSTLKKFEASKDMYYKMLTDYSKS